MLKLSMGSLQPFFSFFFFCTFLTENWRDYVNGTLCCTRDVNLTGGLGAGKVHCSTSWLNYAVICAEQNRKFWFKGRDWEEENAHLACTCDMPATSTIWVVITYQAKKHNRTEWTVCDTMSITRRCLTSHSIEWATISECYTVLNKTTRWTVSLDVLQNAAWCSFREHGGTCWCTAWYRYFTGTSQLSVGETRGVTKQHMLSCFNSLTYVAL